MFRFPSIFRHRQGDERGVSLTTEVLVFVPLGVIFLAFITNAAIHWIGMQYVQYETNMAAKYTAAALGDNPLSYIPGGGANMKPSEYLFTKVNSFWATKRTDDSGAASPPTARCFQLSGTTTANGISRCEATYRTMVVPPVPPAIFGQVLVTAAENISETGVNPNVQ